MVLVEAQAYGLPIISFDCDIGPAEIISQDINGWLCEVGDINGICKNMLMAVRLYDNKDLYKVISFGSLRSAKRFDIDTISTLWVNLIKGG